MPFPVAQAPTQAPGTNAAQTPAAQAPAAQAPAAQAPAAQAPAAQAPGTNAVQLETVRVGNGKGKGKGKWGDTDKVGPAVLLSSLSSLPPPVPFYAQGLPHPQAPGGPFDNGPHVYPPAVPGPPVPLVPLVPPAPAPGHVSTVPFASVTLDKLLGSGGFGFVYEATVVGHHGPVAAKMFATGLPDAFDDPGAGKPQRASEELWKKYLALRKEARALSLLERHPNVVRYLGFTAQGPRCIILMEHLAGGNLRVLGVGPRATHRPDVVKYAHFIITGIARGMRSIHGAGLVHLDLKPENILFHRLDFATPVIADFGLAKFCRMSRDAGGKTHLLSMTTDLEGVGGIGGGTGGGTGGGYDNDNNIGEGDYENLYDYPKRMADGGTVGYIAPESMGPVGPGPWKKTPANLKDVFAFAIVVYEVLTGHQAWYPPVKRYEVYENRVLKSRDRPDLPASWHPRLKAFLAKCWAQDPFERPSFSAIVTTLEEPGWPEIFAAATAIPGALPGALGAPRAM
jgi:serine/threonine protein kinase